MCWVTMVHCRTGLYACRWLFRCVVTRGDLIQCVVRDGGCVCMCVRTCVVLACPLSLVTRSWFQQSNDLHDWCSSVVWNDIDDIAGCDQFVLAGPNRKYDIVDRTVTACVCVCVCFVWTVLLLAIVLRLVVLVLVLCAVQPVSYMCVRM